MARKAVTSGLIIFVLVLGIIAVAGRPSDIGSAIEPIVYNRPSIEEVPHQLGICKTRGMALNAKSVLVVDNTTGAWVYAKYPQRKRPIASLTKLLTAMVYLDMKPNLDTTVYISNRDCYNSAKSHVYKGEAYAAGDLLMIALMASDNRAARAVATASGIPRLHFIERMNKKARDLGMMNTEVFEVTGLDERNVSTAADIAILVKAAMQYPEIKKASNTYTWSCKLKNKKRTKRFVNTNRLVRSRWDVQVGKTGYIIESDYCIGTIMRDKSGREITVVVLGAPWNSVRFAVARKLAFYGFKHAETGGGKSHGQEIAGR